MTDPYGHGETCECERCMAFSEGIEAAPSFVLPPVVMPALDKVTAYVGESYPGLRAVYPPSGVAYLVGLMHGRFPELLAGEHLRALDAICLMKGEPYYKDGLDPRRATLRYLEAHGIGEYHPRRGIARRPGDA